LLDRGVSQSIAARYTARAEAPEAAEDAVSAEAAEGEAVTGTAARMA